ncbi:MAG: chemotaxis protein CheW [Chlamydiota bacterium]|nr:chemotaxis protein CheW [Chlamydiota bacterium]
MVVFSTKLYSEESALKETLDREEQNKILEARALKAAEGSDCTSKDGSFIEVLMFTLSNEVYAIETIYIKEVYPSKEVTQLPCVPPFVHGVINIRRRIYSVVNLKHFFGLSNSEEHLNAKVIILEKNQNAFGILTDEILGVESVNVKNFQTQLPTLSEIGKEFIKGITKNRVIILNGLELLNSEKIVVNETVG